MSEFSWDNEALPALTRREELDRAYNAFRENPFWKMIQREARSKARHSKDQITDPMYTNEQLRFAQGHLNAWEQVPELAAVLYEAEDALLELQQQAENLPET